MDTILTVSQAARELGRSERWLRDAEHRGKIPKAKRDLNGWCVYTTDEMVKLKELLVGSRNDNEAN
ncbi:hypothetical protein ACFLVS_04185 [Chloroflexota bacterium]